MGLQGPSVLHNLNMTNLGPLFAKRKVSTVKLKEILKRVKFMHAEGNAVDSLEESLKWDKSPKSKK